MNREILRDNIIFWSRLGFGFDPVTIDENGHPALFDDTFAELKFHQDFYKKGVKLHSFILNSGWVGVDKYDYTTTDATMDAAMKIGEDVKLIPRIKLNVPVEWCKENPEEVFVYPDGPQTAEEIKALVGTSKHDYLGYEAPDGYYMAKPGLNRPNVGGVISLQSFSSDKWLLDAGKALEKLILHLEEKYGDKIIGYHIAYGTSGETMMWGRINQKYGDYGITNQKKFKAFLKEKYGIEAEIPSPCVRYKQKDNVKDFLRDGNEISVYYDEFVNEVNSDAAEYFCKISKTVAPDKLTGVFYGYFVGVEDIAYTGHTSVEKLINSPYVDFFASPKSYYRCRPGDACGEHGCSQSVNLKKVWVDECDVRTHLAVREGSWASDNMTQTENALTRELGKNLCHNSGFWFMDLGGNWYNSEEMMNLVEYLNGINEKVRLKEHKSVSDVLVLVDEKSVMQNSISMDCLKGYVKDFIANTQMSGVGLDIYRYSDIDKINLAQYKLIIFAYTYKLNQNDIEYIKSKTNASLCFSYLAGALADGKFSFENVKNVTGFTLEEKVESEYDFPAVRILDTDNVVKADEHGEVVYKADGDRKYIMNSTPYLDVETIRNIAKISGCHIYCEAGYTLYTDNRFLVMTATENAFNGMLDFGEVKNWTNTKTGEKGTGKEIKIDMLPYETFFVLFE